MINFVYQLISPGYFNAKYEEVNLNCENLIIKPTYMSICRADERYFHGRRDLKVLKNKLPMALIHECCGEVVFDPKRKLKAGQKVVLIPNIPTENHYELFYENYEKGAKFASSTEDGFMQELISLPRERVVPFNDIDEKVASITELVSVAVHAVNRFLKNSHKKREKIAIWGDGSVSYIIACVINKMLPSSEISVFGHNAYKLSQFSFVKNTFLNETSEAITFDHCFECVGGEGSFSAINDIISCINPQGTVVLLGVSENKIAINTRDILEKGLKFIGCSRSGREDFEKAVELMSDFNFQKRLSRIIYEDKPVQSLADIRRVFQTASKNAFKTVFKWSF